MNSWTDVGGPPLEYAGAAREKYAWGRASAAARAAQPMGLDQFPFDSSTLTTYHSRLIERIARRVVASW